MTVGELTALAAVGVTLCGLAVNARLEVLRKTREQRTDAYLAYLKGMSVVSTAADGSEKMQDGQTLMLDAKHRILLYGNKNVIACLENYSRGRALGSWSHLGGQGRDNFGNLIRAMQKDCRGSSSDLTTVWAILVDEAKSSELGTLPRDRLE